MEFQTKINNAIQYARHSKAVWWYLGYATGIAALGLVILSALLIGLGGGNPSFSFANNMGNIAITVFLAVVYGIVAIIGGIAVNGTVIANTIKGGELKESWNQFRPRLWSLIGAAVLVIGISFIISFLTSLALKFIQTGPLFGLAFGLKIAISIVLALAFFFYQYNIVVNEENALTGIEKSVQMFLEKPIDVILALLILLICTIFLYGTLLVVLGFIGLTVLAFTGFNLSGIIGGFLPLIAIGIPLVLTGHFFIQAFQHHLTTHIFLDLTGQKKTKPLATHNKIVAKNSRSALEKPVRRSSKK